MSREHCIICDKYHTRAEGCDQRVLNRIDAQMQVDRVTTRPRTYSEKLKDGFEMSEGTYY